MAGTSPLLMPKLGLTMTEGVIASWSVTVGTVVRAGDVLFTVETDKIATDVEARGDGEIVSIELGEGQHALVGQTVAMWTGPPVEGDYTDDPSHNAKSGASRLSVDNQEATHTVLTHRVMASPLARRLAAQSGVDLSQVSGSGPRGRIVAKDLRDLSTKQVAATTPAPTQTQTVGTAPIATSSTSSRTRPTTNIEKIVARRLTESKQTIPHFYVLASADISKVLELRQQLNADPAGPVRISINHFILAGVARTLARMPETNAIWMGDEIVIFDKSDVGVAVDTDRGLRVPIIRDAAHLGIDALAAASSALVTKARQGRLQPADMEGGAVTVSNVGMFGAAALIPIINPGQSAILGVGSCSAMFRPDTEGKPVLRQELSLALSCDHRVWNGVSAAKFLDTVRLLLEQPLSVIRG